MSTIATLNETDKPASKQHLYSLDFLRGFAALSVCLLHFTFGVLPNLRDTPLTPFFSWGYIGVHVFFIISGFVIPFALDRSNYRLAELLPFIGKRIVRICPPSYIVMFITIAQRLTIDLLINHNRVYTADLTLYQVVTNVLYIVPYTSSTWLNGVFWTLAVEFQYYIIIGLCFLLLKRNWVNLILFAIICNLVDVSGVLKSVQFFEYNLLFVIGILVWLKYSNRVTGKIFSIFLICLLGIVFFRMNYMISIFSAFTVFCILYFNIKNYLFSFFGKISYSLYLLHTVVGTTIEAFWVRFFPVNTLPEKVALLLVCLSGTILSSYLFYRLIELQFMKIADLLFRKKVVRI